jgi:hypothetical protein
MNDSRFSSFLPYFSLLTPLSLHLCFRHILNDFPLRHAKVRYALHKRNCQPFPSERWMNKDAHVGNDTPFIEQ